MEVKEILGIDVGAKRTGIARSSNVARLAEPLQTVDTKDALSELEKYITNHSVEAVAVGLPRNLSGDDTEQTAQVRDWAEHAKSRLSVPLYWQDEALTSKLAQKHKSSITSKPDEHALAAAIILQDFLDSPEAERMLC